ncbi:TPA: hypothetical protein RTH03_000847 [Campylobacter jejuni]|nr:hypothetical protein [Campylobacter jejuni]HDZ5083909.1 hypothetical protein [Campylobacter jejuni]HDZ5085555.1 hypothetical protein [Campylobacter jejuni]HDZ5087332.1 hypothetical protein [Campylobacter jejuni]HDZ5090711.1 hypothetical protein [Campylobacter jejuni]
MMIIQKSVFSVEIKDEQKIPNSEIVLCLSMGAVCIWCCKDGKTTIIFHAIHPMSGYILQDFFKLYEQFLNGELNLDEDDDYEEEEDYYDFNEDYEELEDNEEIEINYDEDLGDKEDFIESISLPFGSFALPQDIKADDLRISMEDFQALAQQMGKHYAYTQEELEKLGQLRQRDKVLKLRATLLQQKAFRRVCNLNLNQFQKLSIKELIRVVKEVLSHEYAKE